MFHPTYAWIIFNWYRDNFWVTDKPSCIKDGSVTPKDLERVLETSITLEQFPVIDHERIDELNVGNIVSNYVFKFKLLVQLCSYQLYICMFV